MSIGRRAGRVLSVAITFLGLTAISGICWHSVEEIHYLKSFFPRQFTVQEAYYASGVELIKVAILCFPILAIVGACLYLLHRCGKDD